jgi:hypothetical protein
VAGNSVGADTAAVGFGLACGGGATFVLDKQAMLMRIQTTGKISFFIFFSLWVKLR